MIPNINGDIQSTVIVWIFTTPDGYNDKINDLVHGS